MYGIARAYFIFITHSLCIIPGMQSNNFIKLKCKQLTNVIHVDSILSTKFFIVSFGFWYVFAMS
jgi:hypothetical protein